MNVLTILWIVLVLNTYCRSTSAQITSTSYCSVCPWCEAVSHGESTVCECGATLSGVMHCDNNTLQVRANTGWCVTLTNSSTDYNTSTVVAGRCPYHSRNISNRATFPLPSNPAKLDKVQCSHYRRTDLLCSQCIENNGPAVFSFDTHCSACSNTSAVTALALYVVSELLPIVLLFIVLWLCHIGISSGPMFGYIIFCQTFIIIIRGDTHIYDSVLSHLPSGLEIINRSSLTMSAAWNLLFFRFLLPTFCLSSKLTGVHVSMLRLSTAIFPLLLIAAVYIAMETNFHNTRGMRCMCYLLYKLRSKVKKHVTSSDSVVRVFATFMMMSVSLVTYEAHAMVLSTSVYNSTGHIVQTVLYSDPSIKTFTSHHFPYLLAVLLLLFLLVLCPAVVLIVYPTPLYVNISDHISPRKQLVIKIFAETFQECFKDGLNGTRDYRTVPGLAILSCVLFIAVEIIQYHNGASEHSFVLGFVCIALSLAVSCARPCKTSVANTSLCFHFTLLGMWNILQGLWYQDQHVHTEALALSLVLLPLLPHMFMLLWLLYRMSMHLLSRYHKVGSETPWQVVKSAFKTVAGAVVCHCLLSGNRFSSRSRVGYGLLPPA